VKRQFGGFSCLFIPVDNLGVEEGGGEGHHARRLPLVVDLLYQAREHKGLCHKNINFFAEHERKTVIKIRQGGRIRKAYIIENYFGLCRLEQLRQNKNILYRHDKPNEPTKKGPLSFVLSESPFTSVSTFTRGPPLSSLSGWD
jgi:hypothetical protein